MELVDNIEMLVAPGDWVEAGQVIARNLDSGRMIRSHATGIVTKDDTCHNIFINILTESRDEYLVLAMTKGGSCFA